MTQKYLNWVLTKLTLGNKKGGSDRQVSLQLGAGPLTPVQAHFA